MWRSGIFTSSGLLTMRRQSSSTKRKSSRCGEKQGCAEDTGETVREREWSGAIFMTILLSMNTMNSVRLRPIFKARMTVRMFGMTMVIPKTMTISRIMRREGRIRILFTHLRN